MSDDAPEEISDDDLRAVVQRACHQAAGDNGLRTDMVLGEFVILANRQGWDEEGDQVTQVLMIPDGANHRIIGLLRVGIIRSEDFERQYQTPG